MQRLFIFAVFYPIENAPNAPEKVWYKLIDHDKVALR